MNETVVKLFMKYQPKILEVVGKVKAGIDDYEVFGKEVAGLITELLNISIKDLL